MAGPVVRMSLVDRVVAAVAPRAALERARARTALGLVRNYEAARPRRASAGWMPTSGSPGSDVVGAGDRIRARSRDACRNNPYAKSAVDILVRHSVGHGIRPRSTLAAKPPKGIKAASAKATDLARMDGWRAWAESLACDHGGRMDFYGLTALVRRTAAESGEALVRLRVVSTATARRLGLPMPLQLQVLEPDYLDSSRDSAATSSGGSIVGGIEHDADGRRTAYWLFRRHPGDAGYLGSDGGESVRVQADEVLHIFRQTRPGQPRGVPELHAALLPLEDLRDFQEAWIMRAKVEACLAAFVHDGVDGSPPVLGPDGNPDVPEDVSLSPGAVIRLKSGQQVTTLTPSSSGGQVEFVRVALRSAAASIGIGYDQLASDPSQSSYSSLRASRIEFRRQVESDQWTMMIPQLCQPVYAAFCRMGFAVGLWSDAPATCEWMPPSFDLLDPTHEIPAMRDAVRGGFMTPQQAIMSQGYDPDEQLTAYAEWNAKLDAAGITLDSDPRRTSQQGQGQKADLDVSTKTGPGE